MDKQSEAVFRSMEEHNVRFIRLWFSDVLGSLKSVAIAPGEVEGALAEGVGFDGSAIEGFARVLESDMVAHPDPSTFQILPWRNENGIATARMFCDIRMRDGSPSFADPRYVLKRAMDTAADAGFTFYVHPEIEFFLLKQLQPPVPLDSGGYFDHTMLGEGTDFRREAITTLEEMGIAVEFSHHEGAPGQHEIDLRYADALTMADNIMTFRVVVRELAISRGINATFMPKPFTQFPGSGMHSHLSLFEGDTNAFYDAADEYHLSRTARHFIAGLLRHAPEITAVTNQWVNSYKRLAAGDEAPAYVSWGRANRSALIRVPQWTPGKTSSARIEYRALDSGANPYLGYAVLLRAGLKGIEEEYPLPQEAEELVYNLSARERRAIGIEELPRNLDGALRIMENSELVADTLGEHVFDHFLRNKYAEFDDYRRQTSQWEIDRHITVM
ncbi:glutamine synthetase [Tessaracoccus oleiagri]|uniref:Glutamine synthetase n=2 Tax=Tessaracoccus oleiagri TaxID=686624 RepID=A0A1G9KX72_9ACTN|nr:glutamine synthetase [Tessaracoccus oleiagri]